MGPMYGHEDNFLEVDCYDMLCICIVERWKTWGIVLLRNQACICQLQLVWLILLLVYQHSRLGCTYQNMYLKFQWRAMRTLPCNRDCYNMLSICNLDRWKAWGFVLLGNQVCIHQLLLTIRVWSHKPTETPYQYTSSLFVIVWINFKRMIGC